jgi:delta1-piperideine-2-carboxylate reductase
MYDGMYGCMHQHQASSAMARGEISMHLQAGAALPPGCAIDINGKPTVDPSTALAGAQLTFG